MLVTHALAVAQPIDGHPAAVYLAGLRVGSGRRSQQDALTTIAQILAPGSAPDTCPWWEIRYEHAVFIRAALVEHDRPAMTNRHLATLPAGRALDPGEIRSLFTTIAQSGGPAAARDAALLAVL